MNWKPVAKADLSSIEDRLPPSRKVATSWIPGRGLCYCIVKAEKPHYKRRRTAPPPWLLSALNSF